jgi:hypothetical protein
MALTETQMKNNAVACVSFMDSSHTGIMALAESNNPI